MRRASDAHSVLRGNIPRAAIGALSGTKTLCLNAPVNEDQPGAGTSTPFHLPQRGYQILGEELVWPAHVRRTADAITSARIAKRAITGLARRSASAPKLSWSSASVRRTGHADPTVASQRDIPLH